MKKRNMFFKEALACFAVIAVLYLFYRSVFVLIALFAVYPICRGLLKKEEMRRLKNDLNVQFKDMLISLTAAMRAGYSVENALKEALKEMNIIYGPQAQISKELTIMVNQLKVGMPAEEVFDDFAKRSEIEDINTFSEVFKIAKRSGGDMAAIMNRTTSDISAKVDTRNEIAVLISAKRLEQNIMLIMPSAIIIYMSLISDGLLDPLYKNPAGILIMTICLGLYVLAAYLGRKITDIEV